MIYFLDTNIFVGYVIFEDPWHEKSLEVFNRENLYWSPIVKEEAEKKLENIYLYLNLFIDELEEIIFSYADDMLSLTKFNKIMSSIDNKFVDLKKRNRVSKRIWEEFPNQDCIFKQDLLKGIRNYKREMKFNFFYRRKVMSSNLFLHNPNKKIYRLTSKLIGIHSPDNKIILDAHDLAIKSNDAVHFVSADRKLCDVASNFNFLKIKEFNYLGTFV